MPCIEEYVWTIADSVPVKRLTGSEFALILDGREIARIAAADLLP